MFTSNNINILAIMEEFVENRKYKVISNIAAISFLISTASLLVGGMWIAEVLFVFIFGMPLTLILFLIGATYADRPKYTKRFIQYIRNKTDKAETISELMDIKAEFIRLAVNDNGLFKLSYPTTLKEVYKEIEYKVKIIKQLSKNDEY